MFGFNYRIEIYARRRSVSTATTCFPFLHGDELVGRVDLKSDRATDRLLVQSVFGEPGINEGYVAEELAAELALMAEWLGLGSVEVVPRGDLAGVLAAAVSSR